MGFPRGYPERRPPSVISCTSDRRSRERSIGRDENTSRRCEAHIEGRVEP
jgi:hypothetical protein